MARARLKLVEPSEGVGGTRLRLPPVLRSTLGTFALALRRGFITRSPIDGLADAADRLSWHALRHSFASMLATDLELPATTLARLTGHSDAGFTLKVCARDGRDEGALVEEVLARAAEARVGGKSAFQSAFRVPS